MIKPTLPSIHNAFPEHFPHASIQYKQDETRSIFNLPYAGTERPPLRQPFPYRSGGYGILHTDSRSASPYMMDQYLPEVMSRTYTGYTNHTRTSSASGIEQYPVEGYDRETERLRQGFNDFSPTASDRHGSTTPSTTSGSSVTSSDRYSSKVCKSSAAGHISGTSQSSTPTGRTTKRRPTSVKNGNKGDNRTAELTRKELAKYSPLNQVGTSKRSNLQGPASVGVDSRSDLTMQRSSSSGHAEAQRWHRAGSRALFHNIQSVVVGVLGYSPENLQSVSNAAKSGLILPQPELLQAVNDALGLLLWLLQGIVPADGLSQIGDLLHLFGSGRIERPDLPDEGAATKDYHLKIIQSLQEPVQPRQMSTQSIKNLASLAHDTGKDFLKQVYSVI